ncbi:MAG: hypothetical protein ACKO2P_14945 [Planctomycetota bacterium]
MKSRRCIVLAVMLSRFALQLTVAAAEEYQDVRTVKPDLEVPAVQPGPPKAGIRVLYRGRPGDATGELPKAVLMLPENWKAGESWPVFVELPGNGGYRDPRGDECSGRPEDCCLGYGLTEGKDWIWLCLPFLNGDGSQQATTWWGDASDYNPAATIDFWEQQLEHVCEDYGGDRRRMVLAGFSRGAIAVNALGLRSEKIADRWMAFFPNSHYDGVRRWPFPESSRQAAGERLRRLRNRPQLISGEGNQVEETRRYLQASGIDPGNIRFLPTGFINHTDRWVLRPCPARDTARQWLKALSDRSSD